MIRLRPDSDICVRKAKAKKVPLLILSPREAPEHRTGILWIHGGGYITGMKEMVYMSRAMGLVKKLGCTVISPGYRLAFLAPYPAAVEDCYEALVFMRDNAPSLGIDPERILIGGESAGGGLCAALCMMARDKGIKIAFQMPLYPMLDNFDTESSRDNHGRVWNTRKNHFAWKMYLRGNYGKIVSPYAAPARQTDYAGLPPAYTFVGDQEPFYRETLDYVEHLRSAGIAADIDVYHTDVHAFDMLKPTWEVSRLAIERFEAYMEKTIQAL